MARHRLYAITGSYDRVKRLCRRLSCGRPLPFRRIEVAPGDEAQVDFGRGAPLELPAAQH